MKIENRGDGGGRYRKLSMELFEPFQARQTSTFNISLGYHHKPYRKMYPPGLYFGELP